MSYIPLTNAHTEHCFKYWLALTPKTSLFSLELGTSALLPSIASNK